MSEVKVSELPEASSVNDEDLVMIVQNNINKKATRGKIGNIAVSSTEPTTGEKVWLKHKDNLFDIDNAIITNAYFDSNTGEMISGGGSYVTENYTEVEANKSYNVTGASFRRVVFYNANKEILSVSTTSTYFTTPDNTKYIRIQIASNTSNLIIQEGTNYIKDDIYILNENEVYVPYMKEITDNDTGNIVLDDGLNIHYRKVGKLVTLNINYRGDQAQTSKQLTAYGITELATLPTGYRPSAEIDAPLFVRLNNAATTDCYLIIYTNGKIDVFNWGTAKTAVGIIGNVSFFVS